jgi:predicted Zn-dependent protease
MADAVRGQYFDGESAGRHEVNVSLTAGGVEIAGEDVGRLLWPLDRLQPPEPLPGGGVRLATAMLPEARLVVAAPGFREELLRLAPRLGQRRQRWRRHRVEIAVVAATVLILAGAVLAIPRLARPLAQVLPHGWEDRLADMTEHQLVAGRRLCDGAEGVAALNALIGAFPIARRYDRPVSVRVLDWKLVNAFAAPGGRVMLMRGLIEKAETPEEVAGVLAHELGHVIERHPSANAIRQLGLSALLSLVFGDSGAVLDALGQGGAVLVLLAYTRDDEAAADRVALELLDAAGIDARGLADFFARLAAEEGRREVPADLAGIGFLRSHPATAARRERAQAAAGQGRRPALSPEQWQALRAICG